MNNKFFDSKIRFFNVLMLPSNTSTFNINTFKLSTFYNQLSKYYKDYQFDNNNNDILYAYAFNKFGLLCKPYPIKGKSLVYNADKDNNYLSNDDIILATDIENNKFDNYFNSIYKYNIIYFYNDISKAIKGYAEKDYSNPHILEKEVKFYLFVSKIYLNKVEFNEIKDRSLKFGSNPRV
jgi:hypothetical protein